MDDMELFRPANFYDNGALLEAADAAGRADLQSAITAKERENAHARKMHSDDNMSALCHRRRRHDHGYGPRPINRMRRWRGEEGSSDGDFGAGSDYRTRAPNCTLRAGRLTLVTSSRSIRLIISLHLPARRA